MSDPGPAEEFEVVMPDDVGKLAAELKRRGVKPGDWLRVQASNGRSAKQSTQSGRIMDRKQDGKPLTGAVTEGHGTDPDASERATTAPERLAPELASLIGSVRSGRGDLSVRSKEILRAEFPDR